LPLKIDYKGELVLRGEAVIKYSDFERINKEIPDIDAKYKNPRNLCSGTVRQLNNKVTSERKVNFFAFALVKAEGVNFSNSRINQLEWLSERGFETVEFKKVESSNMKDTVSWFAENIENNDLPSDGLVLIYDDIIYGQRLGTTAKFPRDAIAFKWKDEVKETKLQAIEWSASRTGLINPIAIFEPVELEGTTVSRASLHNVSIMKELKLGIGDIIKVYKANMIIPQVQDNITKSNNIEIPIFCPVCDTILERRNEKSVETLLCPNENCLAKQIKGFTHFVAREAMNMEGLSEATIEKLISKKLIKELADLFHVEKFKNEILTMDGFGEKSFNRLIAAVNMARKTSHAKFLYSLGIPNIGVINAKVICKASQYKWETIENLNAEELLEIDGIGPIMAESFTAYFAKPENRIIVADLLNEIEFEDTEISNEEQIFKSKIFVITGLLLTFENREKLKGFIEDRGGKVTDSVTSKTNYLINNDNLSNSSKNKKAKELGIKIITETEFLHEVENA
jgi:DNA ligase (NAD+)